MTIPQKAVEELFKEIIIENTNTCDGCPIYDFCEDFNEKRHGFSTCAGAWIEFMFKRHNWKAVEGDR